MGGVSVADLVATLGVDDHGFESKLGGLLDKFGPFGAAGNAAVLGIGAAFVGLTAAAIHFGDQIEDAYNGIRIGTGATGEALAGLEDDFKAVVKNVPTSFGDASTAIADLNTRLGLTGRPLERMASQFLKLSKITKTDVGENIRLGTRLFGDWSISSDKQAGALDKVFRAAQQSGIGISDLMQTVVEFGAPLRNMGFGFDDSISMLAKWEKEGVNTSTVLTGMKFGLKQFAKAGEDPKKALAEIIPKIHDMKDAQAAMNLGMKTFGLRAGPDMVAAIREGRFQYSDLEKTIRGGSDTIGKAERDTRTWHDSLTLLKNNALVALEPVLTTVVGKLGEWSGALVKSAQSGTVGRVFSSIGDAFGVVKEKLTAAWHAIAPIVMPVLRDWLRTVQVYMRLILPVVSAVFKAIVAVVKWAWPTVKTVILGALQVIAGIMRAVMAVMRGDWSGAWKAVQQIAKGAGRVLTALLRASAAIWKAVLSAAWSAIKSVASAAWGAIVSAIKTRIASIVSTVRGLPGRILSALGNLGRLLYDAGAQIISGLIQGIEDKLSALWGKVSSIAGKIRDLKGPLDYDRVLLRPAGHAIMAGLVQGIDEGTRGLERKLGEVTRSIGVSPSLQGGGAALAGAGSAAGPLFSGCNFIGAPPSDWADFVRAHAADVVDMGLSDYDASADRAERDRRTGY